MENGNEKDGDRDREPGKPPSFWNRSGALGTSCGWSPLECLRLVHCRSLLELF